MYFFSNIKIFITILKFLFSSNVMTNKRFVYAYFDEESL